MNLLRTILAVGIVGLMLAGPVCSVGWAAEGGDAGKIEHKAPTEGKSGVWLWLAELYNNNLFYYAVLVTVVMGTTGVVIGVVTDKLFKMAGMG